jgi:hypothetical protein
MQSESGRRNDQRDARRSIGIATIIEAQGRQRGATAIATKSMAGTGAGIGIGMVTKAGIIALESTILTTMVTATSVLGTRDGTMKMTPKAVVTGIKTGTTLKTKSQTSLHPRIRRRNFLYRTKRCPETRPPLWSETPG